MSETDLNGVLFVDFPTAWSLERSRDVLEHLIRQAGEDYISPFTVYLALAAERLRAFQRLPPVEKAKLIGKAWRDRAKRFPPKNKPINLQDWSF